MHRGWFVQKHKHQPLNPHSIRRLLPTLSTLCLVNWSPAKNSLPSLTIVRLNLTYFPRIRLINRFQRPLLRFPVSSFAPVRLLQEKSNKQRYSRLHLNRSVHTKLIPLSAYSPPKPQRSPWALRLFSQPGCQVQRLPCGHERLCSDERGIHRFPTATNAFKVLSPGCSTRKRDCHWDRVYCSGLRRLGGLRFRIYSIENQMSTRLLQSFNVPPSSSMVVRFTGANDTCMKTIDTLGCLSTLFSGWHTFLVYYGWWHNLEGRGDTWVFFFQLFLSGRFTFLVYDSWWYLNKG